MTLGRPAKGLPRYYMDVGWYQHPRFVGLSVEALFVFEAAVGYCTKHATDGRIPTHPEDLAAVLGLRSSIVRKALKPLIEREALEPTADALVIRGWADHNPTSEEIEQHAQAKSGAGSYGNHVRWHEQRGIVDPDCNWCPEEPPSDLADDRTSDPPSDPNTIADPSLGMGWDGMGTGELSSSVPFQDERAQPDDEDQDQALDQGEHPPSLGQLVGAALAVLVDRDLDSRQQNPQLRPIGDVEAWRRTAHKHRTERGQQAALVDLARAHPDADAQTLADLLEPPAPAVDVTPWGAPVDHRLDGQQQAMMRRAQAGVAQVAEILATPPADHDVVKRALADARHATQHPHDPT